MEGQMDNLLRQVLHMTLSLLRVILRTCAISFVNAVSTFSTLYTFFYVHYTGLNIKIIYVPEAFRSSE